MSNQSLSRCGPGCSKCCPHDVKPVHPGEADESLLSHLRDSVLSCCADDFLCEPEKGTAVCRVPFRRLFVLFVLLSQQLKPKAHCSVSTHKTSSFQITALS